MPIVYITHIQKEKHRIFKEMHPFLFLLREETMSFEYYFLYYHFLEKYKSDDFLFFPHFKTYIRRNFLLLLINDLNYLKGVFKI